MIWFPGAAEYCQQDKRTCRRPECPGNQATFFYAPTFSFFSFSSTQWPLTETNHLIKIHCTTILLLKHSINMAVVCCHLDCYLQNTTVCLCYGIEYRITEDVLHYGKRSDDMQVIERHPAWNCAVCWDGNLHRTSQKYYIPTRPRNIAVVNKSNCYHWQEWEKRSKQVENYCHNPKHRNLCSFV